MSNLRRDASFVVRIWWEPTAEGPPLWRGQVVHALTGETRYFARVEDLVAFMEQWAGRIRMEVLTEPPPERPQEENDEPS